MNEAASFSSLLLYNLPANQQIDQSLNQYGRAGNDSDGSDSRIPRS